MERIIVNPSRIRGDDCGRMVFSKRPINSHVCSVVPHSLRRCMATTKGPAYPLAQGPPSDVSNSRETTSSACPMNWTHRLWRTARRQRAGVCARMARHSGRLFTTVPPRARMRARAREAIFTVTSSRLATAPGPQLFGERKRPSASVDHGRKRERLLRSTPEACPYRFWGRLCHCPRRFSW